MGLKSITARKVPTSQPIAGYMLLADDLRYFHLSSDFRWEYRFKMIRISDKSAGIRIGLRNSGEWKNRTLYVRTGFRGDFGTQTAPLVPFRFVDLKFVYYSIC